MADFDAPPPRALPAQAGANAPVISDTKSTNPYDDPANRSSHAGPSSSSNNNPYHNTGTSASSHGNLEDEDARLARQLQAEEDARARGSHSPYPPQQSPYLPQQQSHSPYPPQNSPFPGQLPPRPDGSASGDKSKGLFGKIFSAAAGKKMGAEDGADFGDDGGGDF
ncbi:hypothetical protein N0V88_000490 [Collariella sp. IMI 366227]|nr:hypothetical protein N0V88_000490 [Collariella sp. IMI 366227]